MNSEKNDIMIREAVSQDAALLADIIRKANRDVALRFHLTMENAPKHPALSP